MQQPKDLYHLSASIIANLKHHEMPTLSTTTSDVQCVQAFENIRTASNARNRWSIGQGGDGQRQCLSILTRLFRPKPIFGPAHDGFKISVGSRGKAYQPSIFHRHYSARFALRLFTLFARTSSVAARKCSFSS